MVREVGIEYTTSGVNVAQYRKKVEQFIRSHEDHIVIHKIRQAEPLTPLDLQELERFLFEAEETGSKQDFEKAFGPQDNLGAFIRRLVGLDRGAAKKAFGAYLDGKTFSVEQIRFINFIVDYVTKNGVMGPGLLYEPPFTDIHEAGLDGIFGDGQANGIVSILSFINESVEAIAS